jgi:hypothetical protein
MYFNKQNERWSLNYKNKYVKGSAARLDKHGSHQGAVAESAKEFVVLVQACCRPERLIYFGMSHAPLEPVEVPLTMCMLCT